MTIGRCVVFLSLLVHLLAKPSFAETTVHPEPMAPQVDTSTPPAEDEFEVALAPVAVAIIAILGRAAINIGRRQIAKSFTEKAAQSIARNYLNKAMRKLADSACYVVEGAEYSRLVLGPDKVTALFAGSHEAYNSFIKSDQFYNACKVRKGHAAL